ncbi:unnamed protein product [Acanthoscelides obtectus]|uniref:Uncharacterized protein n=1 Tax=Acanthoscelides obtectus TaxID=200917 RepID=A0A9P0Q9T5_ACAOB|nr:unnamed protein product [Acanthoscelides obtectus]CAK1646255.1 hypothetical protein AOBTE_LOCUS14534 [Acanthoscelides obtectus]
METRLATKTPEHCTQENSGLLQAVAMLEPVRGWKQASTEEQERRLEETTAVR